MTTTDPPCRGGQTPDVPEPSGADLARIALHAARANAKKNGAAPAKARRPRRLATTRDTGREPQGFGAILQALLGERAWELPAAGGTLLDAWPDIAAHAAPRLANHVHAHTYDTETGRLDLRADSPAYATQIRLMTRQLIAAANQHTGREAVRTIRVLGAGTAPRAVDAPRAAAAASTAPAPALAERARTRQNAAAGYQQALAAHQAAKSTRPSENLAVAAARERQTRALNAHRHVTFATDGDARRETRHAKGGGPDDSLGGARARALQRLAAERAGRAAPASPGRGRTP